MSSLPTTLPELFAAAVAAARQDSARAAALCEQWLAAHPGDPLVSGLARRLAEPGAQQPARWAAATALLSEASAQQSAGDLAAALSRARAALALAPELALVHTVLAALHVARREVAAATVHVELARALEALDPAPEEPAAAPAGPAWATWRRAGWRWAGRDLAAWVFLDGLAAVLLLVPLLLGLGLLGVQRGQGVGGWITAAAAGGWLAYGLPRYLAGRLLVRLRQVVTGELEAGLLALGQSLLAPARGRLTVWSLLLSSPLLLLAPRLVYVRWLLLLDGRELWPAADESWRRTAGGPLGWLLWWLLATVPPLLALLLALGAPYALLSGPPPDLGRLLQAGLAAALALAAGWLWAHASQAANLLAYHDLWGPAGLRAALHLAPGLLVPTPERSPREEPPMATSRFDQLASQWDDNPARVANAQAIAAAIAARVPLQPAWQALDYGAGTGLLGLALRPHVGQVQAVDTSADMLEVLRQKVAAADLSGVEAVQADLHEGPWPGGPVDLVVSAMTLHHLRDVPLVLGRLVAALRPGGWIAVADLDREDGSFHGPEASDVYHLGFDRAAVAQWLTAAGCTAVGVADASVIRRPTPSGGTREFGIFLAVAQRPAACGRCFT
ncbi:MAG: class I SAM-dependent methyltransferase [Fimbriimonadaceae bacterium]|nr:class I SAM-dependent methyltransferase [Fimbriimonadaceae bacterium]